MRATPTQERDVLHRLANVLKKGLSDWEKLTKSHVAVQRLQVLAHSAEQPLLVEQAAETAVLLRKVRAEETVVLPLMATAEAGLLVADVITEVAAAVQAGLLLVGQVEVGLPVVVATTEVAAIAQVGLLLAAVAVHLLAVAEVTTEAVATTVQAGLLLVAQAEAVLLAAVEAAVQALLVADVATKTTIWGFQIVEHTV